MRSLITLKALTYAPTGGHRRRARRPRCPSSSAACATGTTATAGCATPRSRSTRSWSGGYTEEATCLARVAACAPWPGRPSQLQIMYGLAGERRLTEMELPWLPGYEGSKPVRIGNARIEQHQLDVYGEVMDALHARAAVRIAPSEDAWRMQRGLMEFLESDWQEPDEGIWEVRGPRRQFTHSKVMAWVAFDRAVKSVEEFGLEGGASSAGGASASEIHDQVCRRVSIRDVNSFVQYYGRSDLDASLLMMPLVGFLPATDPRMRGTVDCIQRRLDRNGFVDRYAPDPHVDGLPAGEGAFLLCTFWLADNLALQGRYDEAKDAVRTASGAAQRCRAAVRAIRSRSASAGRKLPSGVLHMLA